MAEENFVHKTLDKMLDVIEVELKLPLGVAEVKMSPTQIAKEWRENQKKRNELENAIQRAEEKFTAEHQDQKVAQMIHELPLYSEEEFKQVIASLLIHLSEEKITWLAEVQLTKTWGNVTSAEEIRKALELYLPYLRHELNGIKEFRDVISALTLERIDETTARIEKDIQQIKGTQNDFRQQSQQFEDLTSRRLEILLQQLIGGSNQITVHGLELSPPDDFAGALAFLQSDELLEKLQRDNEQQFQKYKDLSSRQSDLLLRQMMGVSNQIAVQGLELSSPDDVMLRPSTFLQRDELIKELQKDLRRTTCLFLIDGSGKGKTQLAVSLHELWNGTNKYWITLRNKGELQDKHLRIQVVRWLYQATEELSYWQRYLMGDITFREIVIALAEFLKDSGMLVIDDFPNPVDFENLYNDLEIITKVFSGYGSKIVATGQWGIPPHIGSRFPSLVTKRSCPSFSLEEILELLSIIQIPTELKNEKIAAMIFATTKGHPSLVAATLGWLEKQGTEFTIETLDNLLSGEPVKDTIEYNRKVLIKTLDGWSKELLYRLSLVGEKLDKKLIFEIANLSPVIVNPSEQFDKLVGPWVDRLDRELFDVSPLLSRVGEDNIPLELAKKIHNLCADRYLKVHTINISDLPIILSHLWQAQDYRQYANVLVHALMIVKTREQANYLDWACSLLLGVKLPEGLEVYWLIMIRSAQLRTRALAGGDFKRLSDDLKLLLKDSDLESNAPAFLFCYMTTGFFAENLPLDIVIPHSFSAIQLLSSHSLLREGFSEDFFDKQISDFIWTNTIRIKRQEDIKLFFEQFEQLDENVRRLIYAAPLAIESSSHMVDQCWLSEREKPQDEQDWSKVLSVIDELNTMLCVQESESLRVAVFRSKAVVYADYLKQRDQADAILDALSEINNPDAYFLVNYSKGCFALDESDFSAAVEFLTIAENTIGESFAYYRFATTRQLVIALEWQNKWELAKKYCLKAIRDFREYDFKSERLEFCELLGELAYIYWASGNPQKACGAMYGYIRELIKYEDVENLRYKEVFNKAGHALGWFSSMSRWGTPPSKTPNDEEYAPVQPGLFGIRRKGIGEHIPPMGFVKPHLLRQLTLFAEGVGLLRMARSALKLSLEYSATEKSDNAFSQFTYITLSTLETILGSPNQALQYGLQARKFLVSTSALGEQSTQSDSSGHIIDEHKKSEDRLRLIIFMPLFAKLIGSNWSETEILDELGKWNTEVLKLKSDLFLADEWLKLIQYFKDLILFWKGDGDIDSEYMAFEHKTSFEIFRELLGSDRTKVALGDAYKSQVRVAISLPNYGEYSRYMYSDVGRFVHRYWLRIAQTQRFALQHPSLFLDELNAISPYDGADTLYEVLISAGRAVGVNLPDDVKMKMKKVKKMTKPWLEG